MTGRIDADQTAGDLTLHTGRAGLGSKVGHDLTLRVRQWSAQAGLDDAGNVTSLRVVAVLSSLEVVRGDGGLKPLSDKDKATILDNAVGAMKAKAHPEMIFEAADLQLAAGDARADGQISLAGVTRPAAVDLVIARDGNRVSVQAHAELVQSDFGIKPYSGMLGALKVRDMVEVRAQLTVLTQ